MSGKISDDQDLEFDDSHSVPESLDEFLNYLKVNWGRTRAVTEPDLSKKKKEDAKAGSVVSSPDDVDADSDDGFDPKTLRKTKEYDVNVLAAALKGTGAEVNDYVPEYQIQPNVDDVKAGKLTEEAVRKYQELAKKSVLLAAELFKACKEQRKKLVPHREEIDKILDERDKLKDPSGADADALRKLVLRKQKVVNFAAQGRMAVEDLRDKRDALKDLFAGIPVEVHDDASIVDTAPNDVAEARRAFLEFNAYAVALFKDSKTTIDPAKQVKKEEEIVNNFATELINEASRLQKTIVDLTDKVEYLNSQLTTHANNEQLALSQRINDLATFCMQVMNIQEALELNHYVVCTTLKERSKPLKQYSGKYDLADKALDAMDDLVEAVNTLHDLIKPSVTDYSKEIQRLRKLDAENQLKKKENDKSKQPKKLTPEEQASAHADKVKEYADAMNKVLANLTKNVNALSNQLTIKVEDETLPLRQKRIMRGFYNLMSISTDVSDKYFEQAGQIKELNGVTRDYRGELTAVDDALISVNAMVDSINDLDLLIKSTNTLFNVEIKRLQKLISQKQALSKAATLKENQLKGLDDSSKVLLYGGLTGIDDVEQQELIDNEQFKKISQLAETLADDCDDDVILVENLTPNSVEDASKATRAARERLIKLYLPQLKKMNDFLKTFPREQALYNNALQQAGMDAANLQDACDELQSALASLYESLGTKIAEADPNVPPPPQFTKEEAAAKTFRRAAEALETDGRQLLRILANSTGEIISAGSPADFDRLVQTHIKAVKTYDAPVQRKYMELQKSRSEITKLNGGQSFEQDRSAGLQAMRRFEQLDLKQCFDDYADARQQACDVLKQAIKDCKPLIESAKKLMQEIQKLTQQADEGLRVTSWLPHGAKNQFNDLREQVEDLKSEADDLEQQSNDGMHITSECRHQVDEAVKTLEEADLYLSDLLAKKIKPEALEKMFGQLANDCNKLMEAQDPIADTEINDPDEFWEKIQAQSASLEALVINLDIDSKSIRLVRGLVRDLGLIMAGAQPPDKNNQSQMEDSVADEIAELIDEAEKLQDNFGEVAEEAIALQEDSQTILLSDIYETVQERTGAWDRRSKSVLNSSLQRDSTRRLKIIYRRLDELEQQLDWEPKSVKQLRAAYDQANKAREEAEAQVAEAAKLAGGMASELQQLQLKQDVMAPFLGLHPKQRIEIKLRDDDDEIELESNNLDNTSNISFGSDDDNEQDNDSDITDDESQIDDGPSLKDAIKVVDRALDSMIAAAKEGVQVLSALKADDPFAQNILNKYIMLVTQQFLRDLMNYERFVEVQSQIDDSDDLDELGTKCKTATKQVGELQKAIQQAHQRLKEAQQQQIEIQKDDDSDSNDDSSPPPEPQKIPQEVHDEIDQRYEHWFSRLDPPPDNAAEIKKEMLDATIKKVGRDFSDGNWAGRVDDEAYRLYSAERDRREEAEAEEAQPQSRFQLTAKFWKENKQSGVDFIGKLNRALQSYEDLLKKAGTAVGADKMELLVKVKSQLTSVDETAAKVLKGLKGKKHAASIELLKEVPAAVSTAMQEANVALDGLSPYFRSLTYKQVRSDKKLRKLWQNYYMDPHQGTVKEQEDFIREYEKGRLNQKTYDRFLKKNAQNYLNLAVPKINEFAVTDKKAWEVVYRQVIKQQEEHLSHGMFGGWMIEDRKK